MMRELESYEKKKIVNTYLDDLIYSVIGLGLGIFLLSLEFDSDTRTGMKIILGGWLLVILGIGSIIGVLLNMMFRVKKAKCIPKVQVLSLTQAQQSKDVIAQVQFVHQGETKTQYALVLKKAVVNVQEKRLGKLYIDKKKMYLDSLD